MKQPQMSKVAGQGEEESNVLLAKEESQKWRPGLRWGNIGLYPPDAKTKLGEPEVWMN